MLTTLAQVLVTMVAMNTPCAYEDSNNCYWNASEAGINSAGYSFTATELNGVACIDYWNPAVEDYCETV